MSHLKTGDTITVYNPLAKPRKYPVIKTEGRRAFTSFRTFNTRIYYGGVVYEYGKQPSQACYNTYIVNEDMEQ